MFLIHKTAHCLLSTHAYTAADVSQTTQSYTPGDNPVYGIPEHKTGTLTSEMAEFDNPIYGSNDSITDSIVVEVNNPIYGDADFEDTVHVYEQTQPAAMASNKLL